MFITGTDNYINIDKSNTHDKSVWYFRSPSKYNTDLSLAYLGWIDFSLVVLSGDFSKINNLLVWQVISILVNNKIIEKRVDARGYEIYKETDEYKNKIMSKS